MRLKGETVSSLPFSLSPLPSPPPSLVAPATQATYLLHCRLSLVPSRPRWFRMWRHRQASRVRFKASSGNSDSTNRPGYEVAAGWYERWVSNSWVRSWKCRANRIFLIWILKGHYWHNPLVSHHSRWQDSHWPQPHNAVISANYLQTKDIWVDKNGSWPLTTVTNKRKIKELKTLLKKQNILEDVICYWAQKIMRDGNKLTLHLYFWGNCGFKLLLQWEHDYTK